MEVGWKTLPKVSEIWPSANLSMYTFLAEPTTILDIFFYLYNINVRKEHDLHENTDFVPFDTFKTEA